MTGSLPTRTWPRCWRRRNIIISSSLRETPCMLIMSSFARLCRKRWNIYGRTTNRVAQSVDSLLHLYRVSLCGADSAVERATRREGTACSRAVHRHDELRHRQRPCPPEDVEHGCSSPGGCIGIEDQSD